MFDAIEHLLYRAQGYYVDKILFIAGHDFLNSDGDWPIPTTTKGTPQFNSNYHIDMYRAGRKLLIKAINYLSEIANVHVMVVPGNHDRESMMHLGDTLELYYENNENVKVDNSDCLMKMIVYGKNMVISDHGDGPKANDLPGIINKVIEAVCARGKSKIGDKTFVDTLHEISTSISKTEDNLGQNVHQATIDALNKFKGKECKIGRARMFAEKSKDLDDPGMYAFHKLSSIFQNN